MGSSYSHKQYKTRAYIDRYTGGLVVCCRFGQGSVCFQPASRTVEAVARSSHMPWAYNVRQYRLTATIVHCKSCSTARYSGSSYKPIRSKPNQVEGYRFKHGRQSTAQPSGKLPLLPRQLRWSRQVTNQPRLHSHGLSRIHQGTASALGGALYEIAIAFWVHLYMYKLETVKRYNCC